MATGVVISGVGQSKIGRKVDRSGLQLTLDATLEALKDAGLKPSDIDGISTWPGKLAQYPAFSPVHLTEVKEALRLSLRWYSGGEEGPGQLSSIINGAAAIKAGLARHVLCYRTIKEGSAANSTAATPFGSPGPDGRVRVGGDMQWRLPFHAPSAVNWIGLYAQRHFHVYGTKREHLGAVALNARRNAMLNPAAIFRAPLTMDQYLESRMISDPLCLLDCDAPTDASCVVILSSADAVQDLQKAPIHIEAMGGGLSDRFSWDQMSSVSRMAAFDAASQMWQQTDLKPKDVDIAELYDGFSILTLLWLEALGFCKEGESGAFVEGGERIARDGVLPLNTQGGQLSGGRLHGLGFVHEAVVQLRGEAGERQVRSKPLNVAVAAAGGGPLGACLLLRKD